MNRKELVKELSNAFVMKADGITRKLATIENIADWIIEDRKRICEPLVEYKEMILKYSGLIGWVALDNKQKEAIEETLKLAGLEQK